MLAPSTKDNATMPAKHPLAGQSLSAFRASCPQQLPAEQRASLVARAKLLLNTYYVRSPLLRNKESETDLLARLDRLADEKRPDLFHDGMLRVFSSLRDLHTTYLLPPPFRVYTAVLPFRVQAWYDQDGRVHFAVTEREEGKGLPGKFINGAEVLTWDGDPVQDAVARSAGQQAGANEEASFTLGVETLTDRPLGFCSLPADDSVIVEYSGKKGDGKAEVPWRVLPLKARPKRDQIPYVSALGATMGVNGLVEALRRSRKQRHAPTAIEEEWTAADALSSAEAVPSNPEDTLFPDALMFESRPLDSGKSVAYLRIRSFRVADVDGFVREVARILTVLASDDPIGLLVDVRGNGGGAIPAAEKLLQLLTPEQIEPQALQFRCTDGTKTLSGRHEPLFPWYPSIERDRAKNWLSEGFPLWPTYPQECNVVGQVFHGPVALLVDARCYSATEIFAAGFKQHDIGPVIGADATTGGGSANVWSDRLVAELLPGGSLTEESTLNRAPTPSQPLDQDPAPETAFTVAIRGVARAGAPVDEPYRDDAIQVPDGEVQRPTLDDVLGDNEDFVEFAAKRLRDQPMRVLRVEQDEGKLNVINARIDSLEATIDKREVTLKNLGKGRYSLTLPPDGRPHLVELSGFAEGTKDPVATLRHHTAGADASTSRSGWRSFDLSATAQRGGALPPWPDFDECSTAETLRRIEHAVPLGTYTQKGFLTTLLEYELAGLARPDVVEAARAELAVLSSMLGSDEATKRWGSDAATTKRWG